MKNLYHLLLKYTYTQNWDSEVEENYFSVPWSDIENLIKINNFSVLYDRKYTLPFKYKEVLKNFNFELRYPIHRNLIFCKNLTSSN